MSTALVSKSKRKLTERDLLMMCVDEPKYVCKALGHDPTEGTGLDNNAQKKDLLKFFYKAWSGLAKYISSQVERGRAVDFPLVGRFLPRPETVAFVPHLDFITSGKFTFPQNDNNISPLSKKMPKNVKALKVSLGAIGENCEFDRELVASILKDVLNKFI